MCVSGTRVEAASSRTWVKSSLRRQARCTIIPLCSILPITRSRPRSGRVSSLSWTERSTACASPVGARSCYFTELLALGAARCSLNGWPDLVVDSKVRRALSPEDFDWAQLVAICLHGSFLGARGRFVQLASELKASRTGSWRRQLAVLSSTRRGSGRPPPRSLRSWARLQLPRHRQQRTPYSPRRSVPMCSCTPLSA